MAPRIGYTLEALRRLQPAACESDVRIVWKRDDNLNVSLWVPMRQEILQPGSLCGVREMRLLALQLNALADEIDRDNSPDPHEVVL